MFPSGAEEPASGSDGVSRSALFTSPGCVPPTATDPTYPDLQTSHGSSSGWLTSRIYQRLAICKYRGAPMGRGNGPGLHWDLTNTRFWAFLPWHYVNCNFQNVFQSFLLCGRTKEACSMAKSSCKVDFSHPTGQYNYVYEQIYRPPPPWENPGCAPV